MREIGAFEAKNKLSELLKEVERGGEVTITRRGKAVAKLVRPDAGVDRGRAIAAAKRIMAIRKDIILGKDLTLKQLIDDGRR